MFKATLLFSFVLIYMNFPFVNTANPSLLHTVGLGLRQHTHRQTKLGEVGLRGGREEGLGGHDGV